jgi:hypothetical protein
MKVRHAYPWLQAGKDSVSADAWNYSLSDSYLAPLADFIKDWDYQSRLRVLRTIRVDLDKLHKDIAADPGNWEFEIQVEIGTGQGTLPRRMVSTTSLPIKAEDKSLELDITVPSADLSNQIILNTSLVLSKPCSTTSALSPRKAGARLWQDRRNCRLEGQDARFPMEAVSFRKLFPGRPQENALWYLRWDSQRLDRDFHGAIRLYVNSDHESFLERVRQEDESTLQVMLGSVMAQIVASVVTSDHSEEHLAMSEPGTLGAQINNWARLAFGDVPLKQVRSTLELRPGDFHAAMQAAAQL